MTSSDNTTPTSDDVIALDVDRRARCLTLARRVAPPQSTIYDLVAVADWLDRGPDAIHTDDSAEWQPDCSCNNPEATHPLGDSAFCSMTDTP